MRTTCLLCDAPVIRPGNIAHSKEWLLCPGCRSDLQVKVNYACKRLELEMVNGPRRAVKPQPWYIPDPRYVVCFCVGAAMVLAAHWMGWWK